MRMWQQKFLSLLLFIINMLSQLSLLFFSGWFIAACAIAGQAGVLAGFNYMVPAAVIRFFALTRISSGYFEKYLSHLLLLRILKKLRANVLGAIFYKQKNLTQSETGQALQQQTEQIAARWSTVTSPTITALSVAMAIGLLFALWWPKLLVSWVALCLVSAVLLVGFSWLHKNAIVREFNQQHTYLNQQRQWLHVSTLWHFTQSAFSHQAIQTQAKITARQRIQADTVERAAEHAITLVALVFTSVLFFQLEAIENASYWVVAFMIFLSARDWLQPLMQAQFAQKRLRQTSQHLFASTSELAKPKIETQSKFDFIFSSLKLQSFAWTRGKHEGPALTASFPATGLFRIDAPTGVGKSSLFDAMTGELSCSGQITVNDQSLELLTTSQRQSLFHYVQQHEHVFSATLAENLKLASPEVSNDDLLQALEWAELSHWAKPERLNTWLGTQGLPVSGGEKKRLFLARAYLSTAPILLLDEPFEGLDEATSQRLVIKLNSLSQTKLLLLVSHLKPVGLMLNETYQLNVVEA